MIQNHRVKLSVIGQVQHEKTFEFKNQPDVEIISIFL